MADNKNGAAGLPLTPRGIISWRSSKAGTVGDDVRGDVQQSEIRGGTMSHHRMNPSRVLAAATLSLTFSSAAGAATTPEAARDFLDISPERVAAFRATMADFVGAGTD